MIYLAAAYALKYLQPIILAFVAGLVWLTR